MVMPLAEKRGSGANLRRSDGAPAAEFPPEVFRKGKDQVPAP
jgi:hypothetical protein